MKLLMKTFWALILFLIFTTPAFTVAEVQWASEVQGFSSQFSDKLFSAKQVLGPPSVMPFFGNSPCSWSQANRKSVEPEWIKVGFDKKIHVTQIAVAENYTPGVITDIFLYDSAGTEYNVYHTDNPLTTPVIGRMSNYFIEETPYTVFFLKLVLNTFSINDYNQIDAIGISNSNDSIKHTIKIAEGSDTISKPEHLGRNVNSKYQELGPVISPDGSTLYFTRYKHPGNMGFAGIEDVWYATRNDDNTFGRAKNIGKPINNERSNFVLSTTQDGNGLLLGNVYYKNGKMGKGVSMTYKKGNYWSFPVKQHIKDFTNLNTQVAYFLASNGKVLLCSIEDENSLGGLDLYVCFLQKDASWSKPKNLGNVINTVSNDLSPFLAHDMKTLFYSTDGYCGFGNQDIFLSRRLDDSWENWSEPVNIGPVLNTSGFDAFFTIPASGDYAYYVSTKNTFGEEDIFRVKLPEAMRPKNVVLLSGRVLNKKTGQPVDARILYEILPEGLEAGIAVSNPKTGEYQIVLPAGKKYGFLAQAEGFVSVSENLDLRDADAYSVVKKDLFIVPIEKGQKITLNNIFFETGEYELLEDSYAELNRAVTLLEKYPDMKVEIAGHTDNVGAPRSNQELSEYRANSVAEYLISQGIDKNRLTVKGYGEAEPQVPNDTEENRQANRRVEFVIK